MKKKPLFIICILLFFAIAAYRPSGLSGALTEPVPFVVYEDAVSPPPGEEASDNYQAPAAPEKTIEPEEPEEPSQKAEDAEEEVSEMPKAPKIYPNEINEIMIIMYHRLTDGESRSNMERNAADFRADLQKLYDGGFRLISLESLMNNEIDVPAGLSPAVLTFDDGWASAFSFVEENGALVPAKNCAVGVINDFCLEYPDFGKAGVFFVNGYSDPFHGAGSVNERLAYLTENGFEIGNHTYSHANLSRHGASGVQKEMALLEMYVGEHLPGYTINSMCYPYGQKPAYSNREFVLAGEHEGYSYSYQWALREAPTKNSANPLSVNFDRLNVPRVRATDNAAMDLGWFLRYYEENPHLKYISDGDKDIISVPLKDEGKLNPAALGGKTLNLYETGAEE